MSDDRPLGQLGAGVPQQRAALPRHTHSSDSTGGPLISAILTDVEIDTDNFVNLVDTAFTLQGHLDPAQAAQFRNTLLTPGVARIFTFPDGDGTLVLLALTQTLTNKKIGDPSDPTKAWAWTLSGATTGKTLTHTSSHTADRTVTWPNASGTVTLLGNSATGTGNVVRDTSPTITTPVLTVNDSDLTLRDGSDTSKQAVLELSSIAASTTRTFTLPNASGTVVLRDDTATLTNKTLQAGTCPFADAADATKRIFLQSSGAVAGSNITLASLATGNRTLTLPDATDTLVAKSTTDTLTNKTMGDPSDPTKALNFDLASATTGKTVTVKSAHTNNRIITLPDASVTLESNASANVHGLPASVNVLGNRQAAGEFIQRGLATTTSGELTSGSVFYATVAVSFPVAFSALEALTAVAVTTNHGVSAKVHSQSTSGFTLELWSMQTGLVNGQSAYWCAVGS